MQRLEQYTRSVGRLLRAAGVADESPPADDVDGVTSGKWRARGVACSGNRTEQPFCYLFPPPCDWVDRCSLVLDS